MNTIKNILLGGIVLIVLVMIYLWVTADRCYYAIKKHIWRRPLSSRGDLS